MDYKNISNFISSVFLFLVIDCVNMHDVIPICIRLLVIHESSWCMCRTSWLALHLRRSVKFGEQVVLACHGICNGVRRLGKGQQRARVLEFSSVVKTGSALVRAWCDSIVKMTTTSSILPSYQRFVNGVPVPLFSRRSFRPREKYLIMLVFLTFGVVCFGTFFFLPDFRPGTGGVAVNSVYRVYQHMQKAGPELLIPAPPRLQGGIKGSIGHLNAVPPGHEGIDHQDVHILQDKQKLQVRACVRISTLRFFRFSIVLDSRFCSLLANSWFRLSSFLEKSNGAVLFDNNCMIFLVVMSLFFYNVLCGPFFQLLHAFPIRLFTCGHRDVSQAHVYTRNGAKVHTIRNSYFFNSWLFFAMFIWFDSALTVKTR